jgi:EAL domain-containing protein (putative c-di-GMP-specific phosphodiesterase class I)
MCEFRRKNIQCRPERVNIILPGRRCGTRAWSPPASTLLFPRATAENILNATGCLGKWLEFEITESLLIDDNLQVRKTLENLRALGVSIAIDDFGTGYSPLNYLMRFPMDVLKIDRSFTLGIDSDPRKNGLVKAFISLGKTLDMEIVAEGVETECQSATLRQMGCKLGQGYLFGEPRSFEEFMAALSAEGKNADGLP